MTVKPAQALGRALVRRCPNCGARGIFAGYFRLRDHCPSCDYHLTGREGFFLGVWVVNFAVCEGLLFILLFSYILAPGRDGRRHPRDPGALGRPRVRGALPHPRVPARGVDMVGGRADHASTRSAGTVLG